MQLKCKQLDCRFNCTDLYTNINQCLIDSSCSGGISLQGIALVVVGCYIFCSQNLSNEADFDDDYSVFKFGRIPSSNNNQQKHQEHKVCFVRFDSFDSRGYSGVLVIKVIKK